MLLIVVLVVEAAAHTAEVKLELRCSLATELAILERRLKEKTALKALLEWCWLSLFPSLVSSSSQVGRLFADVSIAVIDDVDVEGPRTVNLL